MTAKDEELRRIQKAVNNATRKLQNDHRNHQAQADRMIGAQASLIRQYKETISQRDATIRGKDAAISDLKREMANMRFAYGAIS